MPFDLLIESLALGIDIVTAYIFYRLYRNEEADVDIVSKAVNYATGDELRAALETDPGKCIPYASVDGVAEAASGVLPLQSNFTNTVGVVRHELYIEHRSKRTHGFWSDIRKVIKDSVNVRPFCITCPGDDSNKKLSIEVTDPLSSEYFLGYLPVTYDRFEGVKHGFMSNVLDRLFGELTKGYQETERMLGIGDPVVGFGMIGIKGKRIVLSPPEDGKRYIVTTLSKSELLRLLRSNIRLLKACFWISAAVGAGIFGYIVYRLVQRRSLYRLMMWARVSSLESDADQSHCVVCLSNPREVVILDCGHVCLCSECATSLQQPRHCPMCQSAIARYVPIYVA